MWKSSSTFSSFPFLFHIFNALSFIYDLYLQYIPVQQTVYVYLILFFSRHAIITMDNCIRHSLRYRCLDICDLLQCRI